MATHALPKDDESKLVVIVDDNHDYKEILGNALATKGLVARWWGCRAGKCRKCEEDQPFSEAVDFIRRVRTEPSGRLVAIFTTSLHTSPLCRDLAIGEHMQPSNQIRPPAARAAGLASESRRLPTGQGNAGLPQRGQRARH